MPLSFIIFFSVLILLVTILSITPRVKKSTYKTKKLTKVDLISNLKKYKPSKLELFMTYKFGQPSGWNILKIIFILIEFLLFIAGSWGVIATQFNKRNLIAAFIAKWATVSFGLLLILLFITFTTAKIMKLFRFGKIAKELNCSIDDINFWVDKYQITENDIIS